MTREQFWKKVRRQYFKSSSGPMTSYIGGFDQNWQREKETEEQLHQMFLNHPDADKFIEATPKGQSSHTTAFWMAYMVQRDHPESVRTNGHHYWANPYVPREQNPHGIGMGHGGAGFKVVFTDGRVIITNNLWHQGEIPEGYQALIPDNAKLTR